MHILAGILAVLIILTILWDGFETIVLPRRVTREIRLTRLFYRLTWVPWSAVARRMPNTNQREGLISYFGPLSLLFLIILWGVSLILGFALLQWAFGSQLSLPGEQHPFWVDLYLSGISFFTLGFGDVTLITTTARVIALFEGGVGFGFLALIVSYLPQITTSFSRREVSVTMLDERAGTPPTAFRFLVRSLAGEGFIPVSQFLWDWERWSADLMETHLTYPVLAYFRSQHENQSWIPALTMVLDLCALVLVGVDNVPVEPARLTFAMARHTAIDLTQVFNTHPLPPIPDRLPPEKLVRLQARLAEAGVVLRAGPDADRQLGELRAMYEPYMNALAQYLVASLPPWLPDVEKRDNWETTAWER